MNKSIQCRYLFIIVKGYTLKSNKKYNSLKKNIFLKKTVQKQCLIFLPCLKTVCFFFKNVWKTCLKNFPCFLPWKNRFLKNFYAIFRPNFFCYKIPCLNSVQKSIFEDFFPEYEAVTVQKPCWPHGEILQCFLPFEVSLFIYQ